ncbi:MAG: pyrroline-5-carboxylate reductase [Methylohalobius crimeensis]
MEQGRIGFIGAGNMASSLIGGLLADGVPADSIWVSATGQDKLTVLANRWGVHTTTDNRELVSCCDSVVLAVKPQQIRAVAEEIAPLVQERKPLMVSVAAGVLERDLERWLGEKVPIVRSMPNTPALVQSGATGLHANAWVSSEQRDRAESLLRAVGLTMWVEQEDLLDAVTAVSGCGPAYFFFLMEALEKAGCRLGLDAQTARLLVEQTALGAAKLALETQAGPEELRRRVASPGGVTERALSVLQAGDFEGLIDKALETARARSKELSEQLGEKA